MSVMNKLKKNSKVKFTAVLSDSEFFQEREITRMDVPIPSKPPTGKRYPACRLVLTPSAMIQLHHKLSNLMDALAEQGIIKKGEPIPLAHPVSH